MNESDLTEKLKKYESNKLIDIIKNYRQYGYDENIRNIALTVLEERDIDIAFLKMTGNFENNTYKIANRTFDYFIRYSRLAFIFYILILLSSVFISLENKISVFLNTLLLVVLWGSTILYFVFLIKSFVEESNFFKHIRKEYASSGAIVYFFLGMPLYGIMFFYFKRRMKEEMKLID